MAEYLREDQAESYIESLLKAVDPNYMVCKPAWLDDMDITIHDFAYLDGLLHKAFQDWQKGGIPESLSGSQWFLTNSKGRITGGPLFWGKEEEEVVLTAASLALADGTQHTGRFGNTATEAIPLRTKRQEDIFAALVCLSAPEQTDRPGLMLELMARHLRDCFYHQLDFLFLNDHLQQQEQSEPEAARWTAMLQIVKRMHDKIDVKSVLNEVFESMKDIYPGAYLELLMSQDYKSDDARVKPLLLNYANGMEKLSVRAYIDNVMLSKELTDEQGHQALEIAVPLSGKQGVYGVFHFLIPGGLGNGMDLQLVNMLADAAGSAFENAKLYEQSNLLIDELRLINELSSQLSQSLRPADVFEFATTELLKIFKADYCCISEYDSAKDHFRVRSTNVPGVDNQPFPADYGFCGIVHKTHEPIIISDYQSGSQTISKIMTATDSRSLIAAPVTVRGEVNGAILLTHRDPHFFSYDNYKLLQVLATHIGLAIANASLYDAIQLMANQDMLTGLHARHYLDSCVQSRLAADYVGSLLLVDIDNFKQVNDNYGHQIGDRILKQVCDIIKTSIRGGDIAARWGGEELAIYFPFMSAEDCIKVAERIRERVISETDPLVTVSCGVGGWVFAGERISVEALFYCADMALYRAKNGGRNRSEIGWVDTAVK